MKVNSPIQLPAKSPSGARWQRHRIADFSGGMVTSVPENSLKPNQFKNIENLLFNTDGTLRTRDDFRPYAATIADFDTEYNPKDFWVGALEGTTTLLVAQDDGQDLTLIKAGAAGWGDTFGELTTGKRARFVKYAIGSAEELIVCTGADVPARYDGTALTALGLGAPIAADFTVAAEESTVAGEGGIEAEGTYSYKFTFHYDTASSTQYGESAATAAVSEAVSLATYDVAKVKITFSASPTNAVPAGGHIKIYRSRAGNSDGPFYYIGQFTSGDFYDRVPVGAEGDALLPNDGVVPKLAIPFVVDGRLIGSDGERKNKLVWSDQGAPDVFPALNFAYLNDDITGIAIFNRDTFVFTENEVYIVPESNFENSLVKICDKGCVSGETIADVGNGLVWMGKDSVYWANFNVRYADGDFPIPVGRPIEDHVKEITPLYRKEARACYYNKDYYLSMPEKSGSSNTITLTMNVDLSTALALNGTFGGWTKMNWAAESMMEYLGELYRADRAEKVIYTHQKRAGIDYLNFTSFAAQEGSGIKIIIESGDVFGEEISSDKLTRSFGIIVSASHMDLMARMAANYETYSRSIFFSKDGAAPLEITSWLTWSSDVTQMGRWAWEPADEEDEIEPGDSVDTWAGDPSGKIDIHKKFPAVKGKNLKYQIMSNSALDLNILGFYWTFKELPARI